MMCSRKPEPSWRQSLIQGPERLQQGPEELRLAGRRGRGTRWSRSLPVRRTCSVGDIIHRGSALPVQSGPERAGPQAENSERAESGSGGGGAAAGAT